MSPVLLQPDDYFDSSLQFYCIITNAGGVVIFANNLAMRSLNIRLQHPVTTCDLFTIQNTLSRFSPPGRLTLSHQSREGNPLVVNWEVSCITSCNNAPEAYWRWMAVAGAESNAVAYVHEEEKEQMPERLLQLKNSELFYRNLFSDSLNGMLLMNDKGEIRFASSSLKTILGFEAEEIIGKNGFDFVHPDDRIKAFQSFMQEVHQTPEVKFIVIRLLKKNGEWLWCMVRGHNLLNNPHVGNVVVYFHDDTLRKQAIDALQESELRFRSLIRNLQVGVLLQDACGKIIMCNSVTLDIFRAAEEELINKTLWEVFDDVIHEDGTPFLKDDRPVYKAIRTKKQVKDTVLGVLRKATDERAWLIVNADPCLDESGHIQHVVSSVTDISERKKLEQKLLYEQVSHQKQLTQATIDGQEKERKEIGKELHDNIGQQLTTVKLCMELANATADQKTKEMIRLAIKNISHVINEVRHISRSLVPPILGDLGLIESIKELIDSICHTHPLNFRFHYYDFDEGAIAENKKLMFFRILQEHLTNIARYAHASSVEILLKNTRSEVLLEVTDDGGDLDSCVARPGTSLTNIKNRAELFGGELKVTSSPGKGCIIHVSVPHSFQQV